MEVHRLEFRESENPWAPTAVVAEINERTGSGLELVGLAAQTGGTSSAAYVQWPDGRPGALTRTNTPLDRMHQTADLLSLVRARGLPVPDHELVMQLADGKVAVVQERLPGDPPKKVDDNDVDAIVAMNERFAGLLVDRPDVPYPPAFPSVGTGDHPWSETLGRHSDRSRRLLERIGGVDNGKPYEMAGDDLVHTDYSLGNILYDENANLSGVIDWNRGVARGDRRVALLDLRRNLATEGKQYGVQQRAVDRLDEILATTIDPELLRIYWAQSAVHGVHWSIANNFRPDRIEHDLLVAESVLDGGSASPIWG